VHCTSGQTSIVFFFRDVKREGAGAVDGGRTILLWTQRFPLYAVPVAIAISTATCAIVAVVAYACATPPSLPRGSTRVVREMLRAPIQG